MAGACGFLRRCILDWTQVLVVVLVTGIVASVYSVFVLADLLPSEDAERRKLGVIYTSIFGTLLFFFSVSLLRAVYTDPGRVPDWFTDMIVRQHQDKEAASARAVAVHVETKHDGTYRFCRKCDHYKPDRSHHCRVCNRCNLKMDHHCPWINNCVGFQNHKFFLQSLFWSLLSAIFIDVTMFDAVRYHVIRIDPIFVGSVGFWILVVFIFNTLLLLGLIAFSCFHTYLLLNNYTTIEFLEKRGQHREAYFNRFSVGKWRNCTAVLGPNPLVWLLPFRVSGDMDGLYFPTVSPGSNDVHEPLRPGRAVEGDYV